MARVLVLSLTFPPDNVSTAHLMGDLARGLRESGHDVFVVTTHPHYNPIDSGPAVQGRFFGRSDFHGIPVTHIPVPPKSPHILPRVGSWLWFHVASSALSLWHRRPDLVLATSPPLSIGLNAYIAARGAPFIYVAQELYPDIYVGLGQLPEGIVARMLRRLERWTYRRAAAVVTISSDIEEQVRARGAERVALIENWVNTRVFAPNVEPSKLRAQLSLEGQFVVLYAGNVGPYRLLDHVLDAAALVRDEDIVFLIVGGGTARKRLLNTIRRAGHKNVRMLRHMPYELMPEVYAAADACLVPLRSELARTAMPSKVYEIMGAGRPILAVSDKHCFLARLVEKSRCGLAVPTDSPRMIADAVRQMKGDPDKTAAMGRAGRLYVVANNSRDVTLRRYLDLVDEALERPGERAS